jgi:mRNA-degrading endonuclease RelE of RelBE toxin-antitoxin system
MSYDLYLEPEVHAARRELPGNLRQRVRRAFDDLRATPRPAESRPLDTSGIDLPTNIELRRIRIDRWRIIYAVSDDDQWVWLLAIRRRPPYDYEDLPDLANRLPGSERTSP